MKFIILPHDLHACMHAVNVVTSTQREGVYSSSSMQTISQNWVHLCNSYCIMLVLLSESSLKSPT